jgi:hypothetical protein
MSADAAWSYPPGIDAAKTGLDCALAYAAAHFRVFPYNVTTADKHPHIKGWPTLATTDASILSEWWSQWPQADVGWPVPKRIVVVDLDVKHGGHGIEDFVSIDGRDPLSVATPISRTPSGGLHLFFSVEPGLVCGRDLRRRHGLDIDLKTHVGFIGLPTPRNGRTWIKSPLDVAKANAPAWVLELGKRAEQPRPAEPHVATETSAWGRAELMKFMERIIGAPQSGNQDNMRTSIAYLVGGYVAGGEMEENEARDALLRAAAYQPTYGSPWKWSGASGVRQRTLNAFERGKRHPRSRASDWGEDLARIMDEANERVMGRLDEVDAS